MTLWYSIGRELTSGRPCGPMTCDMMRMDCRFARVAMVAVLPAAKARALVTVAGVPGVLSGSERPGSEMPKSS